MKPGVFPVPVNPRCWPVTLSAVFLAPQTSRQHAARDARRQLPRPPAPEGSSVSVQACAADRWRLAIWPLAGGRGFVIPYRCDSRRHPGPCRDNWCRQWYARLTAGKLATVEAVAVLFATWTLPASDHRAPSHLPDDREHWTRDDWRDWQRHVEDGTAKLSGLVSRHLRALSKRLTIETRECPACGGEVRSYVNVAGRLTFATHRAGARRCKGSRSDASEAAIIKRRECRLRYAWVIEWHASGVAHAHAVVVSNRLAAELRAERGDEANTAGKPCESWLADAPPELGRLDLSLARSVDGVRKYVAKLAASMGGELAKAQGTVSGHRHQRTFGASAGMLAPRHKPKGTHTGTMLRRDGSPVRWDSLTWQAEGLAIRVERGDIARVAFVAGNPAAALGLVALEVPEAPRLAPPPTPPPLPRPAATLGPRERAQPFVTRPRALAWSSTAAGARAP